MEVTGEKECRARRFQERKRCRSDICSEEASVAVQYLGKDKKLYSAFMDLQKVYDRIDRAALWSVLKIYGVCVVRSAIFTY